MDETRVLLLAPRYPYPATRGDQRRVLNFLRGLASRATVRLIAFGGGPPVPIEGLTGVSVTAARATALAENLRADDPRLPLQVRLHLDARMRRVVARELAQFRPHVVHATLSRMAPYLPPQGPWHRHLDLIDPASLNMGSRARATPWPARLPFALEARLAADYEARAAALADSCSLVSEVDRVRAPGLQRAAVIPIGVDGHAFPYADPAVRDPILVFFGNLGYFHNAAPAQRAAREVLPRLRAMGVPASLRIAGARPCGAILRLDEAAATTVVGPVERMVDELHRAAVALLPILSGSGMQNKLLEAFSAGTPVVTTPRAIAPIPGLQAGRDCLVGESPQELALACASLLRDPARRVEIARRAHALVRERCGIDGQAQALMTLYGRA